MSIPNRNLSGSETNYLHVEGIIALSAEELLLACGEKDMRAVSLLTGVAEHRTRISLYWHRIAVDTHTGTLLLSVRSPTGDFGQLVSLRQNGNRWVEVQRLDTRILVFDGNSYQIPFIVVCESRVLLAKSGEHTLHVFDVSVEHTLREAGYVTLQSEFRRFACIRRGNDTLIAFAQKSSVSLQRLTSLPLFRIEQVANVFVTNPCHLLFRGDLLLVVDCRWINGQDAVDIMLSFRASGNALTERRVLLDAQAGVSVGAVALAGDRLVISDSNSGNLLVYAFTREFDGSAS